MVLVVKNQAANAVDIRIQSLDWEDPLEEGMATHSSTPAWEILWTEELGGLQSRGLQKNQATRQFSARLHCILSKHIKRRLIVLTSNSPNKMNLLPSGSTLFRNGHAVVYFRSAHVSLSLQKSSGKYGSSGVGKRAWGHLGSFYL